MARTLVIAEIGSCHDGNLFRAMHMVLVAKQAGADVAKFQFWSDPDELAARRKVPVHYRDIYRRYQLIPDWLEILSVACRQAEIEFACTAYLPADVAVIDPLVKRFKVASFEAGAEDLREAHKPFVTEESGKQLLVSLGMGGAEHAGAWRRAFEGLADVRFLHCVSAYPAPVNALQLRLMRSGIRHGMVHGFSDHTDPALTWTGALAVSAGARIVEAHLRVEETDPENPDAPHAMNPQQFDSYVRHIRFAEACLGEEGVQLLQPCEREMAQYRVGGK